jgi:hypothetical protein
MNLPKLASIILVFTLILPSFFTIPVPALFGKDANLDITTDWSFLGEEDDDYFGSSSKIIKDVNGDGYDDMLISAIKGNSGGNNSGQVYLFFGGPHGWPKDTSASKANASIQVNVTNEWLGRALASAGDVNKDGLGDMIIGDRNSNSLNGGAYLFLGRRSGWRLNMSQTDADATFIGPQNSALGSAVDGVGDVNGDGYDDLLIGADMHTINMGAQGVTYLVLGKSSGWAQDTPIENIAAGSFIGEAGFDESGSTLSRAGDVNGDGYDDFLIGAEWNSKIAHFSGQAYLIFGKASGWQAHVSLSKANASFTGELPDAWAGSGIDGGGDVNGDGYDDLLIGACQDSDAVSQGGQVYLILGKPSGWQTYTNLSQSNASFRGGLIEQIGRNMAIRGDLNGDGLDDVVLGMPLFQNGIQQFSGKTFVFPGKAAGWTMDTSVHSSANSLVGQNYMETSGEQVSTGGDVNADGVDDLLIGAAQNNQVATKAGKAYLVLGDHNAGPSSVTTLKAYFDPQYSIATSLADLPSTVYIELKGPGGSVSRKDTAVLNVTSTATPRGFKMRLLETGLTTDAYRGALHIQNHTRPDHDEIGAAMGAMVNLTPVMAPSAFITILVSPPPVRISPLDPFLNATEDKEYNVRYVSTGKNTITKWTLTTNVSWLTFDTGIRTLYGTPNNGDVGPFDVNIKTEDGLGNSYEHSFKATVANALPHILNASLPNATQDLPYRVDLKADDEGQGRGGWSANLSAPWLHFNASTGVLNGTPGPYDAEVPTWANVTFNDGNWAKANRNFSFRVININDAPRILTKDINTTFQDQPYLVKYTAVDPDENDTTTWAFYTNCSSWLKFEIGNSTLFGTPTNNNVGTCRVNVSVADLKDARDFHNFTLTVVNVNDPPVIEGQPPSQATVLTAYVFKVNISDPDMGDVHHFALVDAPKNMTIGSLNGTIRWFPAREQRGKNHVNVSVTDSNATVTKAFDIEVSVPRPTLTVPKDGSEVKITRPELMWDLNLVTGLNIRYDVYLDQKGTPSTLVASDLMTKNLTLGKPLTDNTQYYWSVVPRAKAPDGTILYGDPSPIWSFKVNTGFIPDYTIILDLDNSSMRAKRGGTVLVRMTVQNNGNMEGNITISVQSDLPASSLSYGTNVHLRPKTTAIMFLTIVVPKNLAYGDHVMKITASFGNRTSPKAFKLTLEKPTGTNLFSGIYLVLWVGLIALIACLVAGVAYSSHRRKKSDEARVKSETELATVKAQADTVEDFTIDEIFLIYQDGRLISHVSYKEAHIDNQLFSSMLIALQGFVKESFQTEDGLSRFDYGTRKMILERGQYLILAVALSGPEPKILKENMHILIQKVEGLYAGVIENWDGSVERFRDVNLMLAPLFDIKKGLKIKKEKEEVTVRSGIEFFGGYVRLKVAVSNDLSTPISDVELAITYDQMTMRLSHIQPDYPMRGSTAYLTAIEPNEKRTVAFYLDPLICQESHVDATVKFKNPYGTAGEAVMKRRPVDIVCPIFYTPENINVAMLKRLLGEIQYKDNRIYAIPEWTDLMQVYELARQTVAMHDIQLVRSFKDQTQGNFLGEAWYYGKTKETHEEILLKASVREQPRSLEVQVASSNISSLTGLLAEVSNNMLRLCQEKAVCTLMPCTDKEWKDYIASCETMLDRYGRQETDGQTGVPGPPAAP